MLKGNVIILAGFFWKQGKCTIEVSFADFENALIILDYTCSYDEIYPLSW